MLIASTNAAELRSSDNRGRLSRHELCGTIIPVHFLAQRVFSQIRRQELLHAGDRVGIAVSGGIDSVALLRLMLELRGELGIVLSVVHFNHKLRGAESDGDEQFVASLAREHDLEFFVDSDDVARVAAEERVSVEAAARDVRYGFFQSLFVEGAPGAKALLHDDGSDRSPGSAAPPKGDPQGLKPYTKGATERGPEGPLFHGDSHGMSDGAAESRAPSNPASAGSSLESVSKSTSHALDKILTGHTLDDQAETVLMRMIRGAGLKGLGGIYPRIAVEDDDGETCGEIVRPLLGVRRRELEQYLKDVGQPWREDSTNAESHFTRNRVRQLVVPLLEREFNPSVAENLAELADIARGEEDYWENEVAGWMGTGVHWWEPKWALPAAGLVQIGSSLRIEPQGLKPHPSEQARRGPEGPLFHGTAAVPWLVLNATIDRLWLVGEPIAVQRRLLRAIADEARFPLEFKHVEEILRFAEDPESAGKELSLPLGWKITCSHEEIIFVTPDLREQKHSEEYEYALAVPGTTYIEELGSTLEVQLVAAPDDVARDQLLDAESLGPLNVRNWRAGDRFWPAYTKAPKKIKELLQERHVPQAERRLWPVVESGDEIVWVRGFPVPAKFRAKPGRAAIAITENSSAERPPT